ncbi:Thiosulfate sulfurtransferase rdl2, mitochondrial [Collariella sp. IMI 366227]|nr:Thiosulfate sulfurtransferase rdl2, mitochondrial [Collariella sp. IMI 366227]
MASRRATATLAKALAPAARNTPGRPAATATLSLRQYHCQVQQRPVQQQLRKSVGASPRVCLGGSVRGYSTDSESGEKPLKIWDFEAIQKLTAAPKHDVTIIDVREPGELAESGRIPSALNIPLKSAPDSFFISEEEFEDRFGYPRPARDAEVLFYCRSGVRSRAAAGLAQDAGWTKVGEFPGSWLEWFEKGGKVER